MPRDSGKLSYYSYDSLGNPWLSGGGAVRDFEILKRQRERWAGITYWTGRYPGFRAGERDGIRVRGLGWGRSYLISRITYTICANLRLLWDRADAIGNSISAYAPLLAGLLRPARFYLVAHHYVGRRSGEKYGVAGRMAWAGEWLLMRGCRRLIASNRSVAERVRAGNPRARILVTQNGFDERLLDMPSTEAEVPFILFLGRFDIYMKGLDLLLSAFAGLDPKCRGRTRLILAGAASPKALKAAAELIPPGMASSIALEPNVSEERKRALLAGCLFFCSPSRFEGWGIAALEANAAGKPCAGLAGGRIPRQHKGRLFRRVGSRGGRTRVGCGHGRSHRGCREAAGLGRQCAGMGPALRLVAHRRDRTGLVGSEPTRPLAALMLLAAAQVAAKATFSGTAQTNQRDRLGEDGKMDLPHRAMMTLLLAGTLFASSAPHYLLNLDFQDSAHPGAQSGDSLPALTLSDDVKAADGAADFGTKGVLYQPAFAAPRGPFTIEARFWVRSYSYIVDLVNTATWDDGPTQGLLFRIGGGFFYPPLPRTAYADTGLYGASVSDFDNTNRADLSRCVGEFGFAAASGGTAQWLETYTDRCVELGQWNHMVAVWDGKDARIYLNGLEATDKWRLNGVGSQPQFSPMARLSVGGRRPFTGGDDRHFDGKTDFVRILDTAMDERQIRQRYQETVRQRPEEDFCHGVIVPVSPAAGELCDKDSKFRFEVHAHGACIDPAGHYDLKPTDSVEAEFAHDAAFQDVFLRLKVSVGDFAIGERLAEKGGVFKGTVYWRLRLAPAPIAAKISALAAADTVEWSDPKPMFLSYALPSALRPSDRKAQSGALKAFAGGWRVEGWRRERPPRVLDMRGRAVPSRSTRLADGSWLIAGQGTHPGGLLLVETPLGFALALF
jgi:glycosyltransferase involved in cell wall biosynthesis